MANDIAAMGRKLQKFIRLRNKSEFATNLQFGIDLDRAGLKVTDLGQAFPLPGGSGYQWFIPEDGRGNIRLIEEDGTMRMETM